MFIIKYLHMLEGRVCVQIRTLGPSHTNLAVNTHFHEVKIFIFFSIYSGIQ